jgi:transposase
MSAEKNDKRKSTAGRYSTEFKIQAVKLVVDGGQPSTTVASSLGVNANTVRDWVKTYKENTGQPFVGSGNLRDIDEENRQLRKRLRDLEEENEILKKATVIFARGPKTFSGS